DKDRRATERNKDCDQPFRQRDRPERQDGPRQSRTEPGQRNAAASRRADRARGGAAIQKRPGDDHHAAVHADRAEARLQHPDRHGSAQYSIPADRARGLARLSQNAPRHHFVLDARVVRSDPFLQDAKRSERQNLEQISPDDRSRGARGDLPRGEPQSGSRQTLSNARGRADDLGRALGAKSEDYVDMSFVKELDDEKFFDRLYKR